MCIPTKHWIRRPLGASLLILPLRLTAQTCEGEKIARLTIGARQFHCQGGTCRAFGARAQYSNTDLPQDRSSSAQTNRQRRFDFSVEPGLWQIDPRGPAANRLQNGDVLVAVNGYTVTSERGVEELSTLAVETPVTLLIRRAERMIEVDVTPAWTCEGITVSAGPSAAPPSLAYPLLVRVLMTPSLDLGGGLRLGLGVGLRRRATLGLGIACSMCVTRTPRDGEAEYEFSVHPEVVSLVEDGSAHRAGLAVGDVITHVDGLDLTTTAGGLRFGNLKAGETVEIRYRRGNERLTAALTVDRAR